MTLASRLRGSCWIVGVALALSSGLYSLHCEAQTPPGQGATAPLPPPPEDDPDRVVIDHAVDLLATGNTAEARRVLSPEVQRRGLSPDSLNAIAVLDRLAGQMQLRMPTAAQTPPGDEDGATAATQNRSRERGGAEAVALYTSGFLYGVGTGVWIDALASVDDARVGVWVPLLLGAAGIGAAYLLDNPTHIRPGRASAINTGMLLGVVAGAGVWATHDISTTNWRTSTGSSVVWSATTLGIGLGYGLSALTDSTPASANFTLSLGVWGAALGLINGYIADSENPAAFLLAGEVVGVGAALATTSVLRPGPYQSRWLDLGVIAGGLLAGGIDVLIFSGARGSSAAQLAIIELGMIGGGVAGYLLGAPARPAASTRVSSREVRVTPIPMPLPDGGMLSVSISNIL